MRAIDGSQRSFCSSEPSMPIDSIARPEWTPWYVATLPSPRASSERTRCEPSTLMPGHS